jgi:hypothetical protein
MKALIVGLDPALLDDDPASDPVTSSRVRGSMDAAVASLREDGVDATLFLLEGPTRRAVADLGAALRADPVDAVMIGAGVRLEPSLSWFLEVMVAAVRDAAPDARLCFNEDPEAMDRAVRRVLLPGTEPLPW